MNYLILKKLSEGDNMERDIQKYAHGLSSIFVHMSFKTKYCHNVFNIKNFREACGTCFKEVAITYELNLISIGFDSNHAHMIIDLGKYSEPELRKLFKGTSGFRLLKQFPEIKQKYFWGSGLWGRQYYCYSIGSDMKVLKNYIRKQKFFAIMQDNEQMTLEMYR